jgi:hypothetical protein
MRRPAPGSAAVGQLPCLRLMLACGEWRAPPAVEQCCFAGGRGGSSPSGAQRCEHGGACPCQAIQQLVHAATCAISADAVFRCDTCRCGPLAWGTPAVVLSRVACRLSASSCDFSSPPKNTWSLHLERGVLMIRFALRLDIALPAALCSEQEPGGAAMLHSTVFAVPG